MRQVLFRGKDTEKGMWHHGYYIRKGDNHYIVHYFGADTKTMMVKVNPETIGEFTGLRDKNDKAIFEGDIVRPDGSACFSMKKLEVVEYNMGGFSPFSISGWECTADGDMSEVVGNIIDNPELIMQQTAAGCKTMQMPKPQFHTDIHYDEAIGREVVTTTRISHDEKEVLDNDVGDF